MTTIAFDGRYLAADSLVTTGGTVMGFAKKLRLADGGKLPCAAIVGYSGNPCNFSAFIDELKADWPCGGIVPGEENEFAAVVILQTGEVYEYTGATKHPFTSGGSWLWALGSGWRIAIGALDMGATAAEAVGVAIKRDTSSGGDILVFDTKEWRFCE